MGFIVHCAINVGPGDSADESPEEEARSVPERTRRMWRMFEVASSPKIRSTPDASVIFPGSEVSAA